MGSETAVSDTLREDESDATGVPRIIVAALSTEAFPDDAIVAMTEMLEAATCSVMSFGCTATRLAKFVRKVCCASALKASIVDSTVKATVMTV